ncbi:MAG: 5-formyltetrahydrofolate cyclo-ligase [Gammaproteobacteria bacterium]|nr:5-formyltetrahydrofolate cyclo-ligase [Gammaproteobacteria bacterium]MDH5176268.1 5-formyltetrahydrofolate cyclo-ligase [Gammaproteobacteria bacterium]MDH5226968.1 5-formyltetrahydrofolate cyclo-ligase [Gammaproteobacteria bacterium]
MTLRELRRQLRARRRAITDAERPAFDLRIHASLRKLGVWRRGHRVAAFLGMPGEVDLRPCFAPAWRRGVHLYVPHIISLRDGTMAFVPLRPGAPLHGNRFGIAEPQGGLRGRIPVRHLDTILVPLVGFDALGSRLGMGAGFYDRALRPRLDRSQPFRRPRLIGIAYSVQQVERLDPAPWDVALDLVVTEQGVLRCAHSPP